MCYICCFKQKTAYEMRISDWSSDVCSSDLQMVRTGDMHGAIGKFKDLHANGASDEIRYRSGAMLANAYAITREFREGLMVVEETIGSSAGIEDRDTRHHGLVASGILYNQVGEYELGRRYAQQVFDDNANDRNRCIARNLLVESSLHLGGPFPDEEAVGALRQCEEIGDATLAGFSRIYLARKWPNDGTPQDAVDFFDDHLSEIESPDN